MPTAPIAEVLARHTPELMALPGVMGTYEGRGPDGAPRIVVLVERRSAELEQRVPRRLEGWPVVLEESGPVRAMPAEPDGRDP
jgi:hypothetical protein